MTEAVVDAGRSVLRGVTGLGVPEWARVLRGTRKRVKDERLGLVAAAFGFWGTLALFPALIVLLTVYGMLSEADEVQAQVERILGSVSSEARTVVTNQLQSLTRSGGLGWGLVLGLVGVLWTASSGMANAIKAVALAYGEEESRGFLALRLLALAFTAGALLVVGAAIALVGILPAAFGDGFGLIGVLLSVGRWVGLVLLMAAAIAVLYRVAPRTRHGGWDWAIKGAVSVAVLWALMTGAFSIYVRNFSNYAGTYGTLAGLVILMFWFYLTGLLVVGGAAVAAEMWRVGEGEAHAEPHRSDATPLERDRERRAS